MSVQKTWTLDNQCSENLTSTNNAKYTSLWESNSCSSNEQIPPIYGIKGLLLCLQEPVICPYPQPNPISVRAILIQWAPPIVITDNVIIRVILSF